MTYEIISRLEQRELQKKAIPFGTLCYGMGKKRRQLHKVFKDSFDATAIITQHFLLQKLITSTTMR